MNEWLTPLREGMTLIISLFLGKVVSIYISLTLNLQTLTSLNRAVGGSPYVICVSAVILEAPTG